METKVKGIRKRFKIAYHQWAGKYKIPVNYNTLDRLCNEMILPFFKQYFHEIVPKEHLVKGTTSDYVYWESKGRNQAIKEMHERIEGDI